MMQEIIKKNWDKLKVYIFYAFVLFVNIFPEEKDFVQKIVRSLNEPFLETPLSFMSGSRQKKNNKFVF